MISQSIFCLNMYLWWLVREKFNWKNWKIKVQRKEVFLVVLFGTLQWNEWFAEPASAWDEACVTEIQAPNQYITSLTYKSLSLVF